MTTSTEDLKTKIAFTLQESGVYPYPEFVNPLVELFNQAISEQPTDPNLEWYLERLPDKSNISKSGDTYAAWVVRKEDAKDFRSNDTFCEADTPLQAAKALYEKLEAEKIL